MEIEFLYSERLGKSADAEKALADALAATGVDAEITYTEVSDEEDARKKRFLGNPSIRVGGFDVEYAEREPTEYQAAMRYYSTVDGWKPCPPSTMIASMIREVSERESSG